MIPLLSIIFVYYNTPQEIKKAIKSIQLSIGEVSYEVIIVDNASEEPFKIQKSKAIKIIKNTYNAGYGSALNQAAAISKGSFLLLCNSDIQFLQGSIEEMVHEIKKNKKIGVVAPKVVDSNNNLLRTASKIPLLPKALVTFSFLSKIPFLQDIYRDYHLFQLDRSIKQLVPSVGGACLMVKKDVFEKVSGFDERFFMYFEEMDFCFKIQKSGYKILYLPSASIIHFVAGSNKNSKLIKKYFEKSRYLFFKKYHGLFYAFISEFFLRFITITNLGVFCIFLLSLFLNLFQISNLMMFFGDFGRDYLAARDMILNGKVPLVGIPSSVVWLHQGPLSIYLIGLSFLIGNFNPVAPAFFYGILNSFATVLVYKIGKNFFNCKVGLFSSAFYAASPLVVAFARMPYHTSAIPFFACLFFLILQTVINEKRKPVLSLFFILGMLLQFELSNAVLLFLIGVVFLLKKIRFSYHDVLKAISGFLIGVFPFILYDVTNKFVYTFGFPLWIINRIRLFFGFTLSGNSTTVHIPSALYSIIDHLVRSIFPLSWPIAVGILLFLFLVVFKNYFRLIKKETSFLLVTLWFFIPIIAYVVHTSPGPAYFPLILPALCLLIGFSLYSLFVVDKRSMFVLVILIAFNVFHIVNNNYYMITESKDTFAGWNYGLGPSFKLREEIASFIVSDAKGRELEVIGGGFLKKFSTSVDNYKYLVWWKGGRISNKGKITYVIYEDKKDIRNKKILYLNKAIFVEKYERN